MPSVNMPSMSAPGTSAAPTGPARPAYPWWITVIDWFWTIGFALAAAAWLYLLVAQRRKSDKRRTGVAVGPVCQAMMAAGMAIMFGVML